MALTPRRESHSLEGQSAEGRGTTSHEGANTAQTSAPSQSRRKHLMRRWMLTAGIVMASLLVGLPSSMVSRHASAGAAGSDSASLPQARRPSSTGSRTLPFSCGAPTGDTYGFETCTYSSAQNGSMTFYLYLPSGFASGASFPLVLLLHGGGERSQSYYSAVKNASILLSQKYVNTWSSATVQRNWPSVIVVPQVEGDKRFVNEPVDQPSYSLAPQPSAWVTRTMAITEALSNAYGQIDRTREYITGISMGAVAVWNIAERWPGYFAAAAPVSGIGDPSKAGRLVSLPIWAFHAAGDQLIPVQASRLMISAIRAAGGSPRYTEYAGVGHDIWNTESVYSNGAFLQWLYAQQNAHPTPGP